MENGNVIFQPLQNNTLIKMNLWNNNLTFHSLHQKSGLICKILHNLQ